MMLFSPTLFWLLLASLFLLGILTLGLAAQARRQRRAIDQLTEGLKQSHAEAAHEKNKLALRSDLDAAKDEFICTVSHELRTPLTSIRGALGLLSSGLLGDVDAKAHNLLRIASTNTERLIRLINDILDLERMESGRAPLNLRRCSLYDLGREALETMTALAEAADVELDLTCAAPREAIYFDADADRILQVVTNLLSNAIKFSPPASTVTVEIEANAESLFLKVVDRGRGIPVDKLETVFDRFHQVEHTDASKKGGTGLGLAICRSIIQQHGGTIWAQPNGMVDASGNASQVGGLQTGGLQIANGAAANGNGANGGGVNGSYATRGTTLWVQFARTSRASDTVLPAMIETQGHRVDGLIAVGGDGSIMLRNPMPARESDPGMRVTAER
jgi:signal transduction histidine kinase